MSDTPIITLDDKTRRPLVQFLVDAALYAFHQGTDAVMDGEDIHAGCEAQFNDLQKALANAEPGLRHQVAELEAQVANLRRDRDRAGDRERARILAMMHTTGHQLTTGHGMNRIILSHEDAEVFFSPAAVPAVAP